MKTLDAEDAIALQLPPPAFLDEQTIVLNGADAGLEVATIQTLRELARRVSDDTNLRDIAVAAHTALFDTAVDAAEALQAAESTFGDAAGMLHALFVLDSLRLIRERQAARGAPASLARAVFARHGGSWLHKAEARGDIGSVDWIPGWLRTVASGHMYRLGRLEFVPVAFAYPQRVYRHVRTGEVVALFEAGEPFSDAGVQVGIHTWTSTFVEADDGIVGTPIHPRGRALRQVVRLPRDEWRLVLTSGDPVLDLHVPGEGPLTIASLRDAHVEAAAFFDQYYPEHPFVAYMCDSWLFSPLLEAMLGPDSNIVRWQHEGYLMPDDSQGEGMLEFTFGSEQIDTATAPRDTRLRRALLAHLEQGRPLSCGRYLFLREDLERFGSQPYREASARVIERLTVA